MQVVYLNGKRLQLTWHEMLGQFRHPHYVGLMLCVILVVVVMGPYDHLLHFDALRLAIFYASAFGGFTVLLIGALFACHRWNWAAYSWLTVGFAGLGATGTGLAAALLLGAPMPAAGDLALVAGFNLVIAYLGEIIHATFVMPRVLADLRGRGGASILAEFVWAEDGAIALTTPDLAGPAPAAPVGDQQVVLFGQRVTAQQIVMLEAQEHYVAVRMQDGRSHLLRGRIGDAVALMPEGLGLRVHRSYWIATSALAGIGQGKTGLQLVLTDGTTVPVARQRSGEVRTWAQSALSGMARKKAPSPVPLSSRLVTSGD